MMRRFTFSVLTAALCLLSAQSGFALDLYWKGGSGLFADKNNWWVGSYNSGVTAYQQPISTDNVYFTSAAFASAGGTISIDRHVSCADMIWDANLPNFVSLTSTNTTWFLDIYGEMRLANTASSNFFFRGNLRLLSDRVGVLPITTNGQRLRINQLTIGATGSVATQFVLQDDLYVDDPAQVNHAGVASGHINLINGQFRTNGKNVRCDYFTCADNNLTTRGIDISNSTITIEGSNPYVNHWQLNFNATLAVPNFNLFNTAGSTIHVKTYNGLAWYKQVYMGKGLAYHNFISDAPIRFYGLNENPLTVPTTFNSMRLNDYGYFSHTIYFSITDLYLRGGFTYYTYHRTNVLEVENFHNTATCGTFITLEALRGSAVDSRGIIRKRSAGGTLNAERLILIDFESDIAGGRTYNANNSFKRGYAPFNAVPFNWNLTAPVGQDFYFVARVEGRQVTTNFYANWSEPTNWDVWNGSAWVPNTSGCLPSPMDNVYFGVNSFPAYTAGATAPVAMANKGLCAIDTIAYCNRITWLGDMKQNSSMIFVNTGNILQSELNIFGSAYFKRKMRDVPAGAMNFYGSQPDTLEGDSSRFWTYSVMKRYSHYHIIGDNNVASLDWRTRGIRSENPSTMRSNLVQLSISEFSPCSRHMDSTQVYFVISGGSFGDNGGTANYTGNTTFHLLSANPPAALATGSVTITAGRLPNVVARCNAYFNHTYEQTYWAGANVNDLNDRKCEVQGDLRFYENASFYNQVQPTYFHRLEVTGTMAEYDGNVHLAAGKTYEFSPHPTAKFEIKNGALFSVGDCQNTIKLKTLTGEPITFNVAQAATSDVQYTYIEGMNNTGAPLAAVNSIDGGGNTNINFSTAGAGVTYYWRRHITTGRFTGNWQDAGHWTTNPAQTHGDSLCMPTILDSVIIDPMSSAGGVGNDSIIINDMAFCKTLWFKANKRTTSLTLGLGRLYIGQSLILFTNMPFHNFSGNIYFAGSGDILTNGTILKNANTWFNKAGGEWNIRDNFATTDVLNGTNYGNVYVLAGRLNTNNNRLDLSGVFSTWNSQQLREINLGSSIVNMQSRVAWEAWYFAYTNTLRFNAGTSVINFMPIPSHHAYRNYYMGATNMTDSVVRYNQVNFLNTIAENRMFGRAQFRYARFMGDMRVIYNNSYDSLYLEGGFFYRFDASTTQTLNSPHGKIIANGNPSAFVNIETTQAGQILANRSRFYKAFGGGICLDFVKVKENRAEKATFAATPVAWQPLYSLLKFETGVNSDNINGTATGIWDFSLPIPYDPVIVGGTNFNLCAAGTNQTVPIEIKGNGPYIIEANWTNSLGASGMISDTMPDDDNNANTAYIYNLLVSQMSQTTNYTIEISTQRCGEATPSNFVNVGVTMPVPNALVQVERFDTCVSNNQATWLTFFDNVEQKPMLSILDKLNAGDNDALGEVRSSVHFTPTIQRLPMTSACYPDVVYLRRWWRIKPDNNVGAKVRLYFTEQELQELANNTWLWNGSISSTRNLYPDSEIMVLKYSSGTVGVGPCQIVPHTLVNWNAATSAPFTSTTGNIGIEFEVSSFSAFVIVPIEDVVLASQLLNFDAQLNNNKQVDLAWSIENGEDLAHILVQRAVNNANFTTIGEVAVVAQNALTNYLSLDTNPQNGTNYYRLQLVDNQGNTTYSEVRAVSLQNANNFELFPNPATSEVQIRSFSQAGSSINITVIDALGRTVISQIATPAVGNYTHTLPIQSLTPAVYMLRLEEADGSVRTARFVKK